MEHLSSAAENTATLWEQGHSAIAYPVLSYYRLHNPVTKTSILKGFFSDVVFVIFFGTNCCVIEAREIKLPFIENVK